MAQREYERLTDSKAVQSARTSAAELNQFLDKFPKNYRVKVEIDGQFLSLPRQSIKLLRDSLVEMARGNAGNYHFPSDGIGLRNKQPIF